MLLKISKVNAKIYIIFFLIEIYKKNNASNIAEKSTTM